MTASGIAGRGMVLAALMVGVCTAALAQQTQAQTSAADHSLFNAKGLPLGGFRLFPTLELGGNYDDNVYRTDTGATSDWFFTIHPAFVLTSEWSRHMLRFHANYYDYQYDTLSDQSRADFSGGADGRLDLGDGITVTGTGDYALEHESRTSVDLPSNALKQTRYSDLHAAFDIDHATGRLGIRGGGTYDRYQYDPTQLPGGSILENRDRNRDEYEVYLKGDYEFSPGYAAFTRVSYNARSYELGADLAGFDRNNSGYRVDTGLDMQLTQLIQGSFYVGYLKQNFIAPLKDVSGVDYGASLKWYATELVTVSLSAQHLIEETTVVNAAADNVQNVDLKADYAFRHDIILTGGVGYSDNHLADAGRDDRIYSMSVGAKYLMNEYVYWKLGYVYSRRNSTVPNVDFSDNTVGITLGLQL